jgi:hypothetical protein
MPLHDRKTRFMSCVAHRRCGKTVACVHELNKQATLTPKARFAYIAPHYVQAKDVAWDYLKQAAAPIPGVHFNESELKVTYPNGSTVRLYGADNYDRLRGIALWGVVLDEYGDMDPRAWKEVIRPALADHKGWAIFIGTPKGDNHFREVCDRALTQDDWSFLKLKASETGLLDPQELNAARLEMTEEQYAQEFECDFTVGVPGAYYAKLLVDAEDEGRIGRVPHDGALPVYTAWDLGIGDATSIWFAQFAGREIRLIDYYEASGVGLDHYVAQLRAGHRAKYEYADHYLPHDAQAKELGTGKTREEVLRQLGLKISIAPRLSVDDGITASRILLPKAWIDREKCQVGLNALRNYRAEWDEKRRVLKPRPLHDWSSHGADALRYLAVSYRERWGDGEQVRQRYRKDQRSRSSSAWAF